MNTTQNTYKVEVVYRSVVNRTIVLLEEEVQAVSHQEAWDKVTLVYRKQGVEILNGHIGEVRS